MESGDFITLARVLKTQGRIGEVAVEIHTGIPERFTPGMKLSALGRDSSHASRELEIEDLWPHKGSLVLKFRGVDSISDAEALIGSELQVPAQQRAQLDAGWNFVSDLIGCTVFDHGREIGRIADVQFGAGEAPLLIVAGAAEKFAASRAEIKFDIPFAESYLEAVDIKAKVVRLNLPDGMLELNAPITAEEKQEQSGSSGKKRREARD